MARKTESDYRNLARKKNIKWAPDSKGIIQKTSILPKTTKHKTKWICKKCNTEFIKSYDNLRVTNGCKKCSWEKLGDERRISKREYKKAARDIGAKLVSDSGKGIHDKVTWQCGKCGHVWEASYANIRHNDSGCPSCAGNAKRTLAHYKDIGNENGVSWIGKTLPDTANTRTKWKCAKRGHEWSTTYASIQAGTGCPRCNHNTSSAEKVIASFLSSKGITFQAQKKFNSCKNKHPLPFDFYLPKKGLLIEYHGAQHYKPVKFWGGGKALKERQHRDRIKSDWARANGMTLLVIPYTEKDNIEAILSRYV